MGTYDTTRGNALNNHEYDYEPDVAAIDEAAYETFIAAIDVSQAGTDQYGDLRFHVDCSATGNASEMMNEGYGQDEFWYWALETAKLALDNWQENYPQLVINKAREI